MLLSSISRTALLALVLGLAPMTAHGQDSQVPEDEATTVAPVVVEAQRTRDAISAFVGDVSAAHERNGQIARFDGRVCVGVVNLPPDQAQVLIDRISRAVLSVGLAVGRPGCEPEILIIATAHSDILTPALVEDFGRVFEEHVAYQERKQALLEEFQRPGRPVRWWHMTELQTVGMGDSRLRSPTETQIYRALVVVDTTLVGRVSLNALGDYLAMTALARLSPDADLGGVDTILNLFAEEDGAVRPDSLTDWDLAYLRALYAARSDQRSGALQEAEIARYMERRYRDAAAPDEADAPAPEGD